MPRFVFSLFTLSFFCVALLAQEKVVVDILLFKVKSNVFSLEQVKEKTQELQDFRCVLKNSILASFLEIDDLAPMRKKLSQIRERQDLMESKELHSYFRKLALLEKLLIYSQSRSVNIDADLLSTVEQLGKLNNCRGLKKKAIRENKAIIKLLSAEQFLRSRFSASLESQRLEKVKAGLDVFQRSLERQIQHEFFWQ